MSRQLRLIATTVLPAVVASTIAGQASKDVLFYPFLKGTGTSVQNRAAGGPKTATMVRGGTQQSSWIAGRPDTASATGYALSGSEDGSARKFNYLDTGWQGGMSGDMTIAWFMRYRSRPAVKTFPYYIISGLPGSGALGFRLFHNGNAHLGLVLKEWGGKDLVLGSGTSGQNGKDAIDLHSMTRNSWVHVAIVFDTKAKVATWFLNGMPIKQEDLGTSNVAIPKSTTATMRVGAHTSTNQTTCFDIDDFRLSNRAATFADIALWSGIRMFAIDGRSNFTRGMFNVSAKTGGRLILGQYHGPALAGKIYAIGGSFTGSTPGFNIAGHHVRLNWDPWSDLVLGAPAPLFAGYQGFLNRDGAALATLTLPPNLPPNAVGFTLFHAAVIADPQTGQILTTTNANPLVIFP